MRTETNKICNKCGVEKSLSEYYLRKNRNNMPTSNCKECIGLEAARKRFESASPEKQDEMRERQERKNHLASGLRLCNSCNEIKPVKEYMTKNNTLKYTNCISCRPDVSREYFSSNPDQQVKRHATVWQNRNLVLEYTQSLKELGCADCKLYYPDAMQFDHTCPPSEKMVDIARIHSIAGSSENMLALLKEELAKGEYVCANCHRKRTYVRKPESLRFKYLSDPSSFSNKKHLKYVYDLLNQSSCSDCGEDDFLVLEFDHVRGKKTKNLSRMVRNSNLVPLDELEEEIAKCEIRCANCHQARTCARKTGKEITQQIPTDKKTGRCECGNRKSRESLICNSNSP